MLWGFHFYLHFSLAPLNCVYCVIEFHSQVQDCLSRVHQSFVYIFLGITQVFILLKHFLLNFTDLFLCVSLNSLVTLMTVLLTFMIVLLFGFHLGNTHCKTFLQNLLA